MELSPFLKVFVRDIFRVAFSTFAVYFLADLLKPGFVTNYINLNVLLLFVIASGVATVLFPVHPLDTVKRVGHTSS